MGTREQIGRLAVYLEQENKYAGLIGTPAWQAEEDKRDEYRFNLNHMLRIMARKEKRPMTIVDIEAMKKDYFNSK
jgi:hypothetical protein